MSGGIDRFTQRARRVLASAEDEARGLGHAEIDAHHLLLALAAERKGLAARALAALGLPPEVVRWAVQRAAPSGGRAPAGELLLTPSVKDALGRAADEARRLNHEFVGTEHLLLGLLRGGDVGVAGRVLADLEVTLDGARAEIGRLLAAEGSGRPLAGLSRAPTGPAAPLPLAAGTRRYNLVLPEDLFHGVQQLADRRDTTVAELMRRFLKLGLLVSEVSDTPGSAVVIRQGGKEREILLL